MLCPRCHIEMVIGGRYYYEDGSERIGYTCMKCMYAKIEEPTTTKEVI